MSIAAVQSEASEKYIDRVFNSVLSDELGDAV
jgi:hypothetical protein